MSKIVTTGPIAPAQIQAWKDEYKNVFSIEYPLENALGLYSNFSRAQLIDLLTARKISFNADKDNLIALLEEEDASINVITGYFRRPTLEEIGVAAMNSDGNSFKSAIILYNTTFIGGHPSFENDDEVKTSAIKEYKTITAVRKATVKKL